MVSPFKHKAKEQSINQTKINRIPGNAIRDITLEAVGSYN
jgi:hypothetical protein